MIVKIEIDLPDGVTIGDIREAQGAIMNASTDFVDWSEIYESESSRNAISAPGRILLDIARQLEGTK